MDPRAVATVTTCVLEIERKESNSWWDRVDNWQKKASSQIFYLKGADPENCRREKKGLVMTLLCIPCMHTGAQKPACRHTPKHHYFSWHFPLLSFPVPLLHRLRRRQRMSLCRLSSCSIQWCSPDTSQRSVLQLQWLWTQTGCGNSITCLSSAVCLLEHGGGAGLWMDRLGL